VDLDLMKPNQDLFQITTAVLNGMRTVYEAHQPDVVLVHGDTTTTMAASLAAFYLKIPVGHVEAGLRTYNKYYPFPEEMNRVVTDSVASLYFAPTELSRNNLLKAGAEPASVHQTGNTVVDALFYTLEKSKNQPLPVYLPEDARVILLTAHRRENFGEPMEAICRAVRTIADNHSDVYVVFPVHPNPNVRDVVNRMLGGHDRIHLIEPLDYVPFCKIMARADLILTDSGGVQEEAPSLHKPVLLLRNETERPEAVETGVIRIVGPNESRIVDETSRLLADPDAYQAMASKANPYGDGHASQRILEVLEQAYTARASLVN
jgi:UDP-N-acetylglucosamine 2-epimerase (non-hydrolysing)